MVAFHLFFLLPFVHLVTSLQTCEDSCSLSGPTIRFPFALPTNTNSRCSYPGFRYLVSCNAADQNQTILTVPKSGSFNVQFVDYQSQEVYITDPGNCLAKRFLEAPFDLSETPFVPEVFRTFTFFNCSSNSSASLTGYRHVKCMSSTKYIVLATPNNFYDRSAEPPLPSCQVISRAVYVPVRWHSMAEGSTRLLWVEPECESCEMRGGTCGFNGNTGFEIGCSNPNSNGSGLPRGAKYGIIIGGGIPGLMCIIGVIFYMCGRVKEFHQPRQPTSTTEMAISIAAQPSILTAGLDVPTLESYPKTQLGASGRLPEPGQNTCPICLSEYQPKETLRTIPECRHYFHVDCIDEWLKVNATCPLCRNSPEDSSAGISSPAESSMTSSS